MKTRQRAILSVVLLAATVPPVAAQAPWLEETFDAYAVGLLSGQGDWTGTPFGVYVVSTNSLTGNAVFCDADYPPILIPYVPLKRPVKVPDAGRHVFSFAVRVDTPTTPNVGRQAALSLGSELTAAIEFAINPKTAMMTLRNDFLAMPWPVATWELGTVPGGDPDLTTGTYHVFEVDLDFGEAGYPRDDVVREVRLDGQWISGLAGPIWLAKPMDRLTLINGESEEVGTPDAVFFDSIAGRPAPSTTWLDETFDNYAVGPLLGQGTWTGVMSWISVVSTNSLTGNAAYCDADDPPIEGPFSTDVYRAVAVPDEGEHLFSFAVRVDAPTEPFAPQAVLALGTSQTHAIRLEITPVTAVLTINNDYFDCIGHVVWDLGNVPGGYADLTTGTYHIVELDLDFGRPGHTMDDAVRAVRVDGQSYEFGCGSLAIQTPMDRLTLSNGTAKDGVKPDAVFFDNIVGRRASTKARHWPLY